MSDSRPPYSPGSPQPKSSPFHRGEHALQQQVDVRDQMEAFGRRMIRSEMPEQHREFYTQQPFVVVGAVDPVERVWATIVAGSPGFISAPDGTTLKVQAMPHQGDPISGAFFEGARLAVLGIDPATRR